MQFMRKNSLKNVEDQATKITSLGCITATLQEDTGTESVLKPPEQLSARAPPFFFVTFAGWLSWVTSAVDSGIPD